MHRGGTEFGDRAAGGQTSDRLAPQPASERHERSCDALGRRAVVGLLIGSGITAASTGKNAKAEDGRKMRPQVGDELVYAEGPRKGELLSMDELKAGEELQSAWARDPASGVVRDGSALNRLLVIHLDPATLDDATKERAADGILVYSGFCTHAGCAIKNWKPEEQVLYCHCHFSAFDPRDGARPVSGPAKRSLAGLPVAAEGDRLVVAGEFVGKLGIAKV